MRAFLVFVCLLAFVRPLSAQVAASSTAFSPGDAVRVTVWQYQDLSGQFDIDNDGTVIHPIYQAIRLAGLTQIEAQAEFRRVLTRFEVDPQFVIEPLYRITVGGEVRTPDVYTVTPQTTVLQAVAQAGGPTPQAQVKRVRLLRAGQVITVDLTAPLDHSALRLRSGDQIMVSARPEVWRRRIQPVISTVGSLASMAYLALRVSRNF